MRYRKPDGSATGKRGFKRKMDADAWGAANVTTAKSVGAYIDPQAGRRLVEDFWEPWLAAKKTKAKPSYIETLERAWRVHVMPKWGMREVQSITHDEVQVWVSALAESKSASVVLRAEGILRALLAKAKADKCITRQSMRRSRIAQEASQEARVSDHRPAAGVGRRLRLAQADRAHARTVRSALG